MSAYIVVLDDIDGANQSYFGPFRSFDSAKAFSDKVSARIPEDEQMGSIHSFVMPLQRPLVRNVRAEGWFDVEAGQDEPRS
jgi:hypothetical protein